MPVISLWETTSSNVTGLYFSTLCVCLLAIILNAREISCTKGECHPFPVRGPRVHPERQPCLSLWQPTRRREILSQLVASLHHCPWWKRKTRPPAPSRRVSIVMTRRASLGIIRANLILIPRTDHQQKFKSRSNICTHSSFNDRFASSKTPPISSLDR